MKRCGKDNCPCTGSCARYTSPKVRRLGDFIAEHQWISTSYLPPEGCTQYKPKRSN